MDSFGLEWGALGSFYKNVNDPSAYTRREEFFDELNKHRLPNKHCAV
jgi:hypothetical protein